MPVVSHEVTIDAPRAAVWDTLADIGSVSEWNPIVDHSADTSNSIATGIGAARHCELPGSMGAIDEVVTAWDELDSMAFDVRGARMMRAMHARFDLADAGTATRVSMISEFTMSFGPLGALMAATMGKRMLARNMEQTLAGLKAHVEAQRAAGATSTEEASSSER